MDECSHVNIDFILNDDVTHDIIIKLHHSMTDNGSVDIYFNSKEPILKDYKPNKWTEFCWSEIPIDYKYVKTSMLQKNRLTLALSENSKGIYCLSDVSIYEDLEKHNI